MQGQCVEVKSALWQKIFIVALCGPFLLVGLLCLVGSVFPHFGPLAASGSVSERLSALFCGAILTAAAFAMLRAVLCYRICADSEGIVQTNGFHRQAAKWREVDAYYVAINERFQNDRKYHVEPVMLDAEGAVVFQGFAHLLVSNRAILHQRQKLWQFVETRLEGKRVDAPLPGSKRNLDFMEFIQSATEVDWSKKSRRWKVRRVLALTTFIGLWMSLIFGTLYYLLVNSIKVPELAVPGVFALLFLGPLLPHFIWFWPKWRRYLRRGREVGPL